MIIVNWDKNVNVWYKALTSINIDSKVQTIIISLFS